MCESKSCDSAEPATQEVLQQGEAQANHLRRRRRRSQVSGDAPDPHGIRTESAPSQPGCRSKLLSTSWWHASPDQNIQNSTEDGVMRWGLDCFFWLFMAFCCSLPFCICSSPSHWYRCVLARKHLAKKRVRRVLLSHAPSMKLWSLDQRTSAITASTLHSWRDMQLIRQVAVPRLQRCTLDRRKSDSSNVGFTLATMNN